LKYIAGDIQEKKLYNKEPKNYDQEISDVFTLMNDLISEMDPKHYQSELSEAAIECSKLLDKFAVMEADLSKIDEDREKIRNVVGLILENIEGIKLSTDLLLNIKKLIANGFLKIEDISLYSLNKLAKRINGTEMKGFEDMGIVDVKQMEKILEEEPSNLYVKRKEYYRLLYKKFVEEALVLSQSHFQNGLKKYNNADKQMILNTNKELKELHDKLRSISSSD